MNQYQVPILPEYKSMYVDMGLSEIATIERDRYDKVSAENDQLTRTMGSIRLLNGDKQVIKDAEDRTRAMIGSSDKFQLLGKNVSAAVTDFATDHRILNAMDSKTVADKEDEYANQLRAKGIEVPFQMAPKVDPNTGQVVRDGNGNVVMVKASDVHNTETQGIYGTKVQERLDYDQKILQLLSGIAEDGYSTISEGLLAKGLTTDDVGKWVRTGGTGVSQEKKDKIADLLVDEFLLSPEGNQLYNIKTKLEVNSKDMLKSDKEARAEIQKHIRDLGQKQVGWKENVQQQIADIPVVEPSFNSGGAEVENLVRDDDFSEVLSFSNLSGGDKASLYNSNGSLKELKTNKVGEKSWLYSDKPGERVDSESAVMGKKIAKLKQEIAEKGGIGRVNFNSYDTPTLLRYIHNDPALKKEFPKKPGQTDEQYGAEALTALKSYTRTFMRIPQTPVATADLIQNALGVVTVESEDGSVKNTLEELLDEIPSKLTSTSELSATVRNGLKSIAENKNDGTVQIHLVTDGKSSHIGKYRVSFINKNWGAPDISGTFYIAPAEVMNKGLALSKAVAKVKESKTVGSQLLVEDASQILGMAGKGHSLYAITNVVDTKTKGQRGYSTSVYMIGPDGKAVGGPMSPGQLNKIEADAYERALASQINSVGTANRRIALTNDVKP